MIIVGLNNGTLFPPALVPYNLSLTLVCPVEDPGIQHGRLIGKWSCSGPQAASILPTGPFKC